MVCKKLWEERSVDGNNATFSDGLVLRLGEG